ncbi:TPA: helix-turn-helix domain-containing protein, partial [Streptococcus suis]
MKMILSKRFKNRRKELGFTQKELAEGICEQSLISRVEKLGVAPTSDILFALSQRLQVSMDYFFYHLSSSSRYLTKNILCLVIQIRKLF